MTIYIRRQVQMSLEGVAIFWVVTVHGHDEDGDCVGGQWGAESWANALGLADALVARGQERYIQHLPVEWRKLSSENTPPAWWMSWLCLSCTEAWGTERYTPNPAAHLLWHRKVLGPGRNAEFRARIDQLETENLRLRRGR